jgi:hypothetical protein
MGDWQAVDLSVFQECSNALAYDEFISCALFNVSNAMAAADFGSPRLDAHVAALGHNTLAEAVQQNADLPNESVTDDQLLGICTQFVCLQAARLRGHSASTTVMTSIYIQPGFELRHPVLRFMFHLFSQVCWQTEHFPTTVYSNPQSQQFWLVCLTRERDFLKYDDAALRAELAGIELPTGLRGLVDFELGLAHFLDDPLSNELPKFDCPPVALDIGVDRLLRYRDYAPSTTPSKSPSLTRDEAAATVSQLLSDIRNARAFATHTGLLSLFQAICAWNEQRDVVNFARIVAVFYAFGSFDAPKIFHLHTPADFLARELGGFMPKKFFMAPHYPEFITGVFVPVFCQITERLMAPVPVAHRYLLIEGIQVWSALQHQGFEIFKKAVPDGELPRCKQKEHQVAASMMFPYWGSQIAAHLLLTTYQWGERMRLFSALDVPIVLYCCVHVARTAAIAYEQARVGRAVYGVKNSQKKTKTWTRTAQEVDRLIAKETKTPPEIWVGGLLNLFQACFGLLKVLRRWGNLSEFSGPFLCEEALFTQRAAPILKTTHFETVLYSDYAQEFEFDERLVPLFVQDVQKRFGLARERITAFVKATGRKDDPVVRDAFTCIVINTALLNGISKEKAYRLQKADRILFPCFGVCPQ